MSLAPFLLDACRAAVLVGLALAAMPLLRRAPASVRRLVLVCGLAAALLAPFAARAVPAWRVLPALPSSALAGGAPFAEPAGEPASAPPVAAPAPSTRIDPPLPAARAERSLSWPAAVAGVWLLGALLVVARFGLGLAKARAVVRRSSPAAHLAIAATLREAGVRAEVRTSSEVDAPEVTGVFWPVVLLPPAAERWTDSRMRAVLQHELSHVRARDCLAQAVAQLACAVHWPNPLVWLAARRLRLERELAADEHVLWTGVRPTDYAEHLLAIATDATRARAVPRAALAMAERSELLVRVEAIVRPGALPPRPGPRRTIAIASLGAAALGAVACAAGTGETPARTANDAQPASQTSTGASAGPAPSAAPTATGPLADEVATVAGVSPDRVDLTIRPDIQTIVDEEMARLDADWHPIAKTAIVLDPRTGEVLAITDRAVATAGRPTGSTLKPLVVAAALEEGAVTPADRFDCGKGNRTYGTLTLRDAGSHDQLDVTQIVVRSSNTGISRVFDKLGGAPFERWLRRFHMGAPTGIQLRSGPVEAVPTPIEGGSFRGGALAGGHFGSFASPLHMAAAYAVLANGGVYNAPTLVKRAAAPSSSPAPAGERLLRPETASAVLAMLERVVSDEHGTGQSARVEGARVAGKTGTSDETAEKAPAGQERYYASFIGVAPAESPRFVVLVGALVPSDTATGGRVAAPVFARIVARALGR